MEDTRIVDLYFERSEEAIKATSDKYGRYCFSIASSIVAADEDAEECVNDTYLAAWNSIPPARPQRLSTYLGKLTRNFAISRMTREKAEKRRTSVSVLLDEIAEFTPDPTSDSDIDDLLFRDIINRFLADTPESSRVVFVRRYWYSDSISEISNLTGMSENAVKVSLSRTRNKLKIYLMKEGYTF